MSKAIRNDGRTTENAKICVFCLNCPASEAEHVLPKSWYPSTTPKTVQRVTVPVCGVCADEFEKTERAFKIPLLMGLEPNHADMAGVYEAFKRSWQFDKASSHKEAGHRAGLFRKMSRQVRFVVRPAPSRLEVPVRTPAGLYIKASPAMTLDRNVAARICEKFAKGFHFNDYGTPIPASTPIGFFWGKDVAPEVRASFLPVPVNGRLAPGLRYRVLKEGDCSIWLFLLWGQVEFGALVGKPQSAE
ncbi:hypothetical protein [Corallococcus sicarius]|uniref:hypothetical protein n=1 Tax=Corallococcus sicarius TaxID=2316726 RepID=UPI0011C48E55|nr:hypothetical protein [Corallococcus sicarius]